MKLTVSNLDENRRETQASLIEGQSMPRKIFETQELMAQNGQIVTAGAYGIWDHLSNPNKIKLVDMLNTLGQQKGSQTDLYSKGKWDTLDVRIDAEINNAMPGTIESISHKSWYRALTKFVTKSLMGSNAYGSYSDVGEALPDAIKMLFGKWKVFHTDAHIKVGFDRDKLDYANVGQTEFTDSLHYFFSRAHQNYNGRISLVPTEAAFASIDSNIDLTPAEKAEFKKQQHPGTNTYNRQWNIIYNDMLDNKGGSFWISRINDSDDPTRIRLVIMAGDRERKSQQYIIGDVYGINEKGRSVPVSFSQEESIKMMQARQAWQWANSQDDLKYINKFGLSGFWDGWDPITWFTRKFFNPGMEKGGDFSREEFEYWHNKYSKEVEGSLYYTKLKANAFGGRYFTDWSDPGRVEMDMLIDPVWKAVRTREVFMENRTGKPYQVNRNELYDIFQMVKSGLNAKPDFFGNEATTTYFDTFFIFDNPKDYSKYNISGVPPGSPQVWGLLD